MIRTRCRVAFVAHLLRWTPTFRSPRALYRTNLYQDVAAARVFSRHVSAAFSTDQLLGSSAGARQEARAFDHLALRRRGLTRRECEVLWWVAEGKRNGEIGIILGIAMVTVEVHLTSIYRKLGVEGRMAAVAAVFRERPPAGAARPG